MKRFLSLALLAVLSATALCGRAQGTFQNLDFEAAQIVYVDSGQVDIVASNALPGWSAFAGASQLSTIVFGATGLTYPVNLRAQTNGGSLSGNFSVFLGKGGSGAPEAGSISQTGLVPVGTQSLIFKVGTLFNGPFTVSLYGQNLSYAPLANAASYTSYGADISSFAGQTATLVFMAGINGGSGAAMIDDIQFSPIAIPEPSTACLFALSALFFAVRRFRRTTRHAMKRFLSLTLLTILSATAICVRAQGTFQNLDFESAQLIYVDPPFNHVIATTNALPGWGAFSGTNQLSTIPYGPQGIFYPVMLYSQTNGGSISGFFSVQFGQTGSISQSATVPADAQSLIFKVHAPVSGPVSVVSLNGQILPYAAISTAPNYILYGTDISSFAGQVATLSFTQMDRLDDIEFSPFAIPEPSVASMFALSALFFAARRFRGHESAPRLRFAFGPLGLISCREPGGSQRIHSRNERRRTTRNRRVNCAPEPR